MVSDGNHPLIGPHYDEKILYDYVLGALLAEEEERVRQHLAGCPLCRALTADIRLFCQQLSGGLRAELDSASPGPRLNFDRIVAGLSPRPKNRERLLFRLRQVTPSSAFVLLAILLLAAAALQGLFTQSDTALPDQLELADHYDGPPAAVAVSTESGLVVVRLSSDDSRIVSCLPDVSDPHDPQFSPDGRWLAFRQERTLYVMEVGKDEAFRFAVHETAEWAWSPDGQTLAYTDGNGQLIVFDPRAGTNRVLVPANEAAWGMPVWDADGSHISYMVLKPLHAANEPYLRQGIWGVTVATGYRVEQVRNPVSYDTLLTAIGASSTHQGGLLPDTTLPEALLLDSILQPQPLEWAPNGTWFAYIVPGADEGQGLYLFSLDKGEQRLVELPGGATEKAVLWGDAGHLFLIRQLPDSTASELWMVPLDANQPPQRIMTNLSLPPNVPNADKGWDDVLTVQMLTP
jgi:hypothetical protein